LDLALQNHYHHPLFSLKQLDYNMHVRVKSFLSVEAPGEAPNATNRRVRELVEECGSEVEVVSNAARATVGDDSLDGLAVD
jgi:hypothetical protein